MERNIVIDFKVAGARIRNARQRLGLTQEKAAERTTLTGQYWSLLETGRERGSINTYLQIAAALDVTLDDIFYEDAQMLRVRIVLFQDGFLGNCTDGEKAIISEPCWHGGQLWSETEKSKDTLAILQP